MQRGAAVPDDDAIRSPGHAPVSTTALSRGPNAVLALLGNVGTPTMVRAAPDRGRDRHAVLRRVHRRRDGAARHARAATCSKYIFNVRASYAQEARATLELFKKQRRRPTTRT